MMTLSMSPEAMKRRKGAEERIYERRLRDDFAKAAMQGFCVNGLKGDPVDSLADLAYMVADAMLKARKTGKEISYGE